MMAAQDWTQWERNWREPQLSSAELDAMIERTRHARRGIVLVRALSALVAIVALTIVGAALRHAANPFEMTLGLVVGAGIVFVWVLDGHNQRRDHDQADAPVREYRLMRTKLCARQIQFARFGWSVVALDLTFLIPWWRGGVRVHGTMLHPAQLVGFGIPVLLLAGFVAWTLIVRRRALIELGHLRRMAAPEDATGA
jgi:hypothetical protein